MISTETPTTEYLNERLTQLGIDENQNTFIRVWVQRGDCVGEDGKIHTEEKEQTRAYKIFDADEAGNIVIRYFNLNGQPYHWKKEGTKQSRDFIRKRLREVKGDQKYSQDEGSGQFPFFNPGIIKKYQACKEAINIDNTAVAPIETLYLVEGEFKSFKGYMAGLDIVGLPSIHGFYNGDVPGRLHEDIQELIITCQVQKIVFLVDADLLTLSWQEDKDLYKRPASFYGSIKAFRESLQLLIDDSKVKLHLVYFMHIETKFVKDAKGLDDLLCKYTAVHDEILKDLSEHQFARKYFKGFSILDQNKDVQGRILRHLGLTDEQEFYKTYGDFIGAREFKFKRRRYVYDQEKKEVVYVRHEDAAKFMRIGPDWVKVIQKANKYGELEEEIVPWKKGEIISDYKKFPDFMEQIMRYDDFTIEPAFNGEYKRVHHGCYNLCNPLIWTPAAGPIVSSIAFLKHIFQGTGRVDLNETGCLLKEDLTLGDPFAVALDWLSLLVQKPKHMVPVPILVSKENGTGKSTFLKWLQTIFGSNMCILGNEHFKMRFNSHYITRFIIAIDEGFLEVDKKSEKERLKQLVTSDSAYLEYKGMNVRKINFFGKVIICSNDADRVMKIDEGESRWFVVKVPVVPEGRKDPDLEIKLKNEAAAFLHYLSTRQIFHPRKDRLWFLPEWFITEQFKLIVSETKNRIDRLFEDWIKDQFLLYGSNSLEYPLKYITEQLNDVKVSKYKIDGLEIKAYLKSRGMVPADKVRWISIPVGFKNDGNIIQPGSSASFTEVEYKGFSGRPYTFQRADWVPNETLENVPEEIVRNFVRKNVRNENEWQPSNSEQKDDLPF